MTGQSEGGDVLVSQILPVQVEDGFRLTNRGRRQRSVRGAERRRGVSLIHRWNRVRIRRALARRIVSEPAADDGSVKTASAHFTAAECPARSQKKSVMRSDISATASTSGTAPEVKHAAAASATNHSITDR